MSRGPVHISEVLNDATGDITRIHPRAVAVFEDGFISGYHHGHRDGYSQRAQEEIDSWAPVREHVGIAIKSFVGLRQRREQHDNRTIDRRPPEQIIADAYRSWGIRYTRQEGA